MKVRYGASLSKLTTFRMGAVAEKLWIPETVSDVQNLPFCAGRRYRILSSGSNLLINDRHAFSDVVYMGNYDARITRLGDGEFKIGASARIQKVIKEINRIGYGDIEELVSIPGMIGGLICMNASVPSAGVCISDHLISVEAFDGERIVTISKEKCDFGYRMSRFQDGRSIILSGTFRFPEQDPFLSEKRVRARREYVKATQDCSFPNFGSVFRRCDPRIMSLVRRVGLEKGGASFSRKTSNWLLNDGATFSDALWCIDKVEKAHRIFGRPCEREVVVWE